MGARRCLLGDRGVVMGMKWIVKRLKLCIRRFDDVMKCGTKGGILFGAGGMNEDRTMCIVCGVRKRYRVSRLCGRCHGRIVRSRLVGIEKGCPVCGGVKPNKGAKVCRKCNDQAIREVKEAKMRAIAKNPLVMRSEGIPSRYAAGAGANLEASVRRLEREVERMNQTQVMEE